MTDPLRFLGRSPGGYPRSPAAVQEVREMAEYLVLYSAGATPENVTSEQRDARMKAWMDRFGALGDQVVDMGSPTAAEKVVSPGGAIGDDGPRITGYSIIEFESLAAAAEACRTHPHLDAQGTISVHEAFDIG